MKEHPICLGPSMHPCIQTPEVTYVRETNTMTTQLYEGLLFGNRCLSLWHGHHILTGGRTKPKNQKTHAMSCCLLFKHIHTD